jgi:hypothetical protein
MARLDARVEKDVAAFTDDVRTALGKALVSLVLHGSAAGDDWVPGRSDINTALVVPRLDLDVLERLGPPVARGRERAFALPVLMDREYLSRARDTFPMELDDIRRQHRLLAGTDVFATLELDFRALQRECEYEARAKLLRLRALFLEVGRTPAAIDQLMAGSFKSFTIVLRHFLRLRDGDDAHAYADVVTAGERVLGPLPAMRRLFGHRTGAAPLDATRLRADFGAYLSEVERIVKAVDALGA